HGAWFDCFHLTPARRTFNPTVSTLAIRLLLGARMRQPQQTFFSPVQLLHFSSECCLRNILAIRTTRKCAAHLQGAVFIVEVRPAGPADMVRTQFIATNIWDPVAAFY
ncbi:hypothetical protein LINGRAHAP2_LOCUS30729, partial [Linum grandiflorum]